MSGESGTARLGADEGTEHSRTLEVFNRTRCSHSPVDGHQTHTSLNLYNSKLKAG
jgi:hypothetical protein